MGKADQKVSILLPTYSRPEYLWMAIENCLKLSYRNIEVIIIDNGSIDELPEVVRSLKDGRVKCVPDKQNKAFCQILKTGLEHATGEYITWTTDTDKFLHEAIEVMVGILGKNRTVDYVYADYWVHKSEIEKGKPAWLPVEENLERGNEIGVCFLVRRKTYDEIGGYDPGFEPAEAWEYLIKLFQNFRVVHVPRALYLRGNPSGSSKGLTEIRISLIDKLIKYEYGLISWRTLSRHLIRFIKKIINSKESIKEKNTIFFTDMGRIYELSWKLGFLIFPLLVYAGFSKIRKVIYGSCYCNFVKVWESLYFILNLRNILSKMKISENKVNILCIVPYMVVGGGEKVVLSIAKGTDRSKFSFHVITTLGGENRWKNRFQMYFENVLERTRMMSWEDILYFYFRTLVKRLGIDMIMVSNSYIGYKYIPKLKRRYPNLRFIDIIHNEESPGATRELDWVVPYIDVRVCISEHISKVVNSNYRAADLFEKYGERIIVIRNGIDTEEFSPEGIDKGGFREELDIAAEEYIISFIGRFSWEKNGLLFVEVAQELSLKGINGVKFRFIMAGEGPERRRIEEDIRERGMEKYFVLSGFIDDVSKLLADTWVLVVPSKNEGIPIVITEAMAMKIPVISTDVGGISEIIENGRNGYLIDSNCGEGLGKAFVERIVWLMFNPGEYIRIGENARLSVLNEYRLVQMAARYQDVFERLI